MGPDPATSSNQRRAHTGRRRNETTRQVILNASLRLLRDHGYPALTVEAIAREAHVGKQTIYRWWPSKAAVILEAAIERAGGEVPLPDTRSLLGDLEVFLPATFRAATDPDIAPLLRAMAAEAQRDSDFAPSFRAFAARRRGVLCQIFQRAAERGELAPGVDVELLLDITYGAFWYRFLIRDEAPPHRMARNLARLLAAAAGQ